MTDANACRDLGCIYSGGPAVSLESRDSGAFAVCSDVTCNDGGGGITTAEGKIADFQPFRSAISSFQFNQEKQTITATYEEILASATCYATNPVQCENDRRAYRKTYGIKDGRLQLLKTEEGKIVPAQEERIEWPED